MSLSSINAALAGLDGGFDVWIVDLTQTQFVISIGVSQHEEYSIYAY